MSIPPSESMPEYESDYVIRNPNILGAATVFEVTVGERFRQVDLRGNRNFNRTMEVLPGNDLADEELSDVIFFDEKGRASINAIVSTVYANSTVMAYKSIEPLAEMGIIPHTSPRKTYPHKTFWNPDWVSVVEVTSPKNQI